MKDSLKHPACDVMTIFVHLQARFFRQYADQ